MNGIWKTKDGKSIEHKDLDDNHLLNILKFVKRSAKQGVNKSLNLGYGDHDYIEYYYSTAYGEEVLDHYDYKGLKKEAKKRGLKERDL